jgi:hypothetical protein
MFWWEMTCTPGGQSVWGNGSSAIAQSPRHAALSRAQRPLPFRVRPLLRLPSQPACRIDVFMQQRRVCLGFLLRGSGNFSCGPRLAGLLSGRIQVGAGFGRNPFGGRDVLV